MSTLETAYADGQLAALQKHGLAQPSLASVGMTAPLKTPGLPAAGAAPKLPMASMNTNPAPSLGVRAAKIAATRPTHPSVASSHLLGGKAPAPPSITPAPTSPQTIKSVFDTTEQNKTRLEPAKKLSADICTTCRRPVHYGPCPKPVKTRPAGTPMKRAEFNFALKGEDATGTYLPATSAGYSSTVVNPEPPKSLSPSTPSTTTPETVSIDQTGTLPDAERVALG